MPLSSTAAPASSGFDGTRWRLPKLRRAARARIERRAVEQVVARRAVRALAEPGRRVRLRVEIDDEHLLTRLGETGGEVDGCRRLADAALLVREREDRAGHAVHCPRAGGRSAIRRAGACAPSPDGAETRPASAPPWGSRTGPASPPAHRHRPGGPPARSPRRRRSARRRGPPRRPATSGRHHSAATGGGASARRDGDAVGLERLLLGAAANDPRRSGSRGRRARGSRLAPHSPRAASPRGRAARRRAGCRASRRPSRRRRSGPAKRASTGSAARLPSTWTRCASLAVRDRRQPRRLEQGVEPALEPRVGHSACELLPARRRRTAPGSSPSLRVSTPRRPAAPVWTILRSSDVIGSSDTALPRLEHAPARRAAPRTRPRPPALAIPARVHLDTPCHSAPCARYAIADSTCCTASIVRPSRPMRRPASRRGHVDLDHVVALRHGHVRVEPDLVGNLRHEPSRELRERAGRSEMRPRRRRVAAESAAQLRAGEHARRRRADAQEAALALRRAPRRSPRSRSRPG